jgi:hypothetical protein
MDRTVLTISATIAFSLMTPRFSVAQQGASTCPSCETGCPVCVVAPHKESVKKPAYSSKQEPFCLQRVTLWTFLRHLCGKSCDAPCCEPVRYRTRLVKWEVTEEHERLKCIVEPCPANPPCPIPPPNQK